jgi:hypothetical protein
MTKILLLASVCFALAAGFASRASANDLDASPAATQSR